LAAASRQQQYCRRLDRDLRRSTAVGVNRRRRRDRGASEKVLKKNSPSFALKDGVGVRVRKVCGGPEYAGAPIMR